MDTTFRAGYNGDAAGNGEHNPGAGLQILTEQTVQAIAITRCFDVLLRAMDVLDPVLQHILSFLLRESFGLMVQALEHFQN